MVEMSVPPNREADAHIRSDSSWSDKPISVRESTVEEKFGFIMVGQSYEVYSSTKVHAIK
jgi:hypothetical protein